MIILYKLQLKHTMAYTIRFKSLIMVGVLLSWTSKCQIEILLTLNTLTFALLASRLNTQWVKMC